MPLTALAVQALKPKEKPYKVSHEKGLYLLVNPNGRKYWKLKYRYLGKEKKLSIGEYPEVSLKEATQTMSEARKKIQEGLDPSAEKKRDKNQKILSAENSFEAVAHEWHKQQAHIWSEAHTKKILRLIGELTPWIGGEPINTISYKRRCYLRFKIRFNAFAV